MFQLLIKSHSLLVKVAKLLQHPFLLFVRLYFGWQFFQSGWGKFHRIPQVVRYFAEDLHIPMPTLNVYIAASTECFGGLLLMVGLFSRLISIPLAFTMVVAYATAESGALKMIFSEPGKFTGADPFPFLFTALVVLFFGPGFFSLDRLIDALFIKGKKNSGC